MRLEYNTIYHVYNRAIGNEKLFFEEENYKYFLNLTEKHLGENFSFYSYCLMPNHFHFLLEINHELEKRKPSQQLSNLFNSYTKSVNKKYDRKGSLFMRPYQAKPIYKPDYLIKVVCYIHQNPIHHGYSKLYEDWRFSSYNEIINSKSTNINRFDVIDWFGGIEKFKSIHIDFLNGDIGVHL